MSSDPKCPECNGYRGLPRMLHHDDIPKECDNIFHREVPVPEPTPEPPKVVEMPAPAQTQPQEPTAGPWHPICPHCGQAPGIRAKKINLGGTALMVICCDQCLKMIGVTQILELMPVMPPGVTH